MHLLLKFPRGRQMTAAKRNEPCSATIHLDSHPDIIALRASLAGEEVSIESNDDFHKVTVVAVSVSELRAKLNSVLRSLQAASEALIEVDRARNH